MNNNYITITEVNRYIKEIINEDLLLRKVYLKGGISYERSIYAING